VHSVFEDQSRFTVNGLSSVLFADGVNECISYHAPYLTYAQRHWTVEMFGWDCQRHRCIQFSKISLVSKLTDYLNLIAPY
jgi:hypothetical protein